MAKWSGLNTPKYDVEIPSNRNTEWKEKIRKGIGLNYPYAKGQQGMFDSTYTTIENERIKLLNLLSTISGERVMHPDFGMELEQHLFETITPDLKMILTKKIQSKIEYWLPNLRIEKLTVDVEAGANRNTIYIDITFNLVQNPLVGSTVSFII